MVSRPTWHLRFTRLLTGLAAGIFVSLTSLTHAAETSSFGSVQAQSPSHSSAQVSDFAREAQSLMDSHAAFLRAQGFEVANRPLQVQVLASREEFESFKATSGARSESPRGYYEHATGRIVTWETMSSGISSESQRILTHETFHHQLHSVAGNNIPLWLDEGLSVLFENSASVGGARMDSAGIHSAALSHVKAELAAGKSMPLSTLLSMDRSTFYNDQASDHYAWAWSFVHFLTNDSGQQHHQTLAKVLRAVKSGASVDEALKQAGGVQNLEAAWQAHIAAL